MQSENDENLLDIIDLAHTLRQEQLFIQHEQVAFVNLSETLRKNSSNVAELAWICAQLRQNLNDLILARPDVGPSVCCQRANRLENTQFVDAYKAKGLKYKHIIAYIELFHYLHPSPYLLAQSLAAADRIPKMTTDQMSSVVHTIATSLYGNVIHCKDIEMVLQLLRELIEIQIVVSENPRRMLRAGSSAFARLYHRLHESLFSAKIFLTAALYEPVMKVLVESENVLDMDSNKAIMNFSIKERLKRFGTENTTEYNENIRKYREDTVNQLYSLANLFIENITRNWSLFPSTLHWLVQTMYNQLKQADINDKDINEIITDMVFTHFICPAVVSPDIFGISDAPISEQARFNLIQIGQIIQMLALMKYEDVDPKFSEIYQKFETNVIADLLQQLLVSDNDVGIDVVAIRSQQNDFKRANVLLTQTELNNFVDFLRNVLDYDELIISGEDRRKLSKILDNLPDKFETLVNGDTTVGTVSNSSSAILPTGNGYGGSVAVPTNGGISGSGNLQIQVQNEHGSKAKQSLINLGKSTKNKIAKTMSLNISNHNNSESDDTAGTLSVNCSNVNGNGNHQNYQNGGINPSPSHSIGSNCSNNSAIHSEDNIQVLIFPINIDEDTKLKLLTEEEVLKMNSIGQGIVNEENMEKLDKANTEFGAVLRPPLNKTTRFSVSHDDASIGNSDNLEAVSEAPSNHSVTSSLELEENDQNDNLSDMVSANVSGRGTPNISGRDTPSSQVTDGENIANQIPTPQMAKIINKARSDIEDKFCKFEIKKLIEGDETISIISDTWSTDVLASDSENLDQNDRDRNFSTPLIPSAVILPGDSNFDALSSSRAQIGSNFLDTTETRSESAWSTDVLASDSEKLAEVDTDDNVSIAAKSDTTDAGRSEGGDGGRDQDIAGAVGGSNGQNRTPDSPYFTPRGASANNYRTPDSPMYTPRSSESPFFGASNYDESSRDTTRFSSPTSSSLTRNSVRMINDANNNKGNYSPLGNSRMKRQNSAESSISNQSLILEDAYGAKMRPPGKGDRERCSSKDDLIDFSDFGDDGAAGLDRKRRVGREEEFETSEFRLDKFSEEAVIHRRLSSEQRNASFDGRRNGILDFKSNEQGVVMFEGNPCRRTQSHNYENHEIIKKCPTRTPSVPNGAIELGDDPKPGENILDDLLLIHKTEQLNIGNDPGNANAEVNPIKTSKSTGAIPKSISFDASADKSSKSTSRRAQDPLRVNGNSFFNKLKQGFKNRRSHNKNRLNQDEFSNRNVSFRGNGNSESIESSDINQHRQSGENGYVDITEDILAKYRRKVSSSSEATNSDSTGGSCSVNRKNSDIESKIPNGILHDKAFTFLNAKRKIRAVLSATDLHTGDFRHTTCSNVSSVLTYLHIQLAQALNIQNFQQVSYVSEAIRCLNSLDQLQHYKLIEELQADILKRQSYLQYLMRYRQNLLSIIENIGQFEERLKSEREMCNRHLIGVYVRMFLEKREPIIEKFQEEFCELTVVDEKIDLLEEFMGTLMSELRIGLAESQVEESRISVERILLQRLYRHVMFPNDDGDISRDEVLCEHIRKLQRVIAPSHPALRIPQEYLLEAPWPFAQQQISYISAYRTPREKLQCVIRCISSIMNLLRIACDHRIPTTDDLIPVLIYVVIKANPPYLLSTIQYVNCFIGDKLDGEDQFHWTQFCSVVQFIKTMDYVVE